MKYFLLKDKKILKNNFAKYYLLVFFFLLLLAPLLVSEVNEYGSENIYEILGMRGIFNGSIVFTLFILLEQVVSVLLCAKVFVYDLSLLKNVISRMKKAKYKLFGILNSLIISILFKTLIFFAILVILCIGSCSVGYKELFVLFIYYVTFSMFISINCNFIMIFLSKNKLTFLIVVPITLMVVKTIFNMASVNFITIFILNIILFILALTCYNVREVYEKYSKYF